MSDSWRPGRDRRAVRHAAGPGTLRPAGPARRVIVAGGGIAGVAAAMGLAERGVEVALLERHPQLGGRVRSWPVTHPGASAEAGEVTMSRGFHAFFRQYYNLRSLIRRVDPALDGLVGVADYPLVSAGGHADSFAGIPRTPPVNLAAFVLRSPSFTVRDLARVDIPAALELMDVSFPATFSAYDGESAAQFLDRLRFPSAARHLALEVFARSFFAHPAQFSAGELVAMFHTYFVGSSEGLLFDVPADDYETVLWSPLRRHLEQLGVQVRLRDTVEAIDLSEPGLVRVSTGVDTLTADALVLATDSATTGQLVSGTPELGDTLWRSQIAETTSAPGFAVWRLWLDRPVAPDRPAFLGTSGFGALDNVTVLERFEAGARRWAQSRRGSVVEMHAYAVPGGQDPAQLRADLRLQLGRIYPETAGAGVLASEWLLQDDCPLIGTGPWADRPGVVTPDPRVVLAGDGVRCDLPVALMERAATTGWLAANTLLARWGVAGHDLWTVPMKSRVRGVGAVRRLLGGARTGQQSPGNAPRVRSA